MCALAVVRNDVSPSTVMQSLRDRVGTIARLIPRDRPVVYLDYPVHTNIGDLLIEQGTDRFFEEARYNVVERRSAHDFCDCVRSKVPSDATIVLHGGGNFGDLYELHQPFRERVIEGFPQHRIVMLPQTIHFQSPERLRRAVEVFSRHDNLTVCVRDYASLEYFRRYFHNPVHRCRHRRLLGMGRGRADAQGGAGPFCAGSERRFCGRTRGRGFSRGALLPHPG